MCTNRVVILLIFEVVISVVGLKLYVLVCILNRDIIPIYILSLLDTHRGKDKLLFIILIDFYNLVYHLLFV